MAEKKNSKGSDRFQQVIMNHLTELAKSDKQLAEGMADPKKSISECCDYICGEVSKSGRQGWADDEIYGMAVHYFTEIDVNVNENKVSKVVVNEKIELSEKDKKAAYDKALEEYKQSKLAAIRNDDKTKAKKVAQKPKAKVVETGMGDLFAGL